MSNVIADLQCVSKTYDKKIHALTRTDIQVTEGEILGLVGPNGAGKTTIMKIMLGLIDSDTGKVIINGFDIQKDFKNAIRMVGNLIESPAQYGFLSARDNLIISKNMYQNISFDDIDEMLRLVGLAERAEDKVRKYSLGMKQRLAIAQAMIHKPKLLILDEPCNGLDPDGIAEFRAIFKQYVIDNNASIVISSHILGDIAALCNRVAFIKRGEILSIIDNNGFDIAQLENLYSSIISTIPTISTEPNI